MKAFFVTFMLVLLVYSCTQARAHSFFSPSCCGGQDCKPAPVGDVKWTPKGWAVPKTGDTIPFTGDNRLQYNPPGVPGFFICEIPMNDRPHLICLYAPEPQI